MFLHFLILPTNGLRIIVRQFKTHPKSNFRQYFNCVWSAVANVEHSLSVVKLRSVKKQATFSEIHASFVIPEESYSFQLSSHPFCCSCLPEYSGPNCSDLVDPVMQHPLPDNGGVHWVTWIITTLGIVLAVVVGLVIYFRQKYVCFHRSMFISSDLLSTSD